MSLPKNAALSLVGYCRLTEQATEKIITEHLCELSNVLAMRQIGILNKMQDYRKTLVTNPSEAEFYDLVRLLGGHSKGCDNIGQNIDWNNLCIDAKVSNAWLQNEQAPQMPVRRHLMLAMLDCYVERNLYSGVGRLSQSLERTGGDDLLSGDWRLPVKPQPAYVEWLPAEQWRVADVVLPSNVDWYDRCGSNTHLIEPRSYTEELAQLVDDVFVVDLLMPKGTSERQNLLTRLQKRPGVGSKKAHQIIAWLHDVDCKFLKGGPAREVTLPETDKVVDYHHDD